LVIPSASPAGSAAIKLAADGARFKPELLWRKPEVQMEQTALVSDQLFAAGTVEGKPAVFQLEVADGGVAWKDEGFARGHVLYVNGQLLTIDRAGTLALSSVSGGGHSILTKSKLEGDGPWAAPSMDKGRLYLRDNQRILAFNLNATQFPFETGHQAKEKPKVERESK
jgi:hypothetical protein